MKKITTLLVISIFLLTSCGMDNAKSSSSNVKAVKGETASKDVAVPVSDKDLSCDEFLENYAEWADVYIKLLENFTSNPADPKLAQEYNKLNREYAIWTEDWNNFSNCMEDDTFLKKYNKINRKIEQKRTALRGG